MNDTTIGGHEVHLDVSAAGAGVDVLGCVSRHVGIGYASVVLPALDVLPAGDERGVDLVNDLVVRERHGSQ